MTGRDATVETPVLIAGGGPIGLALAADLGRRGVATLLVEERENKLNPAKMLEVSVRTVRSDIAAVLDVLGVRSRFAAGVRLRLWSSLEG